MPNASQCQYDLPSGKLCRQVALKGEYVCRHHMRLFRHSEAQMLHEEAMARLEAALNASDLTQILRTLHCKLSRLKTAIPAHPEALLTLRIALERLQRRKAADQAFLEFAQ